MPPSNSGRPNQHIRFSDDVDGSCGSAGFGQRKENLQQDSPAANGSNSFFLRAAQIRSFNADPHGAKNQNGSDEDVIILSSDEDSPPLRKRPLIESESLDYLSDLQYRGMNSLVNARQARESSSESSLSDGEIREPVKGKSEKPTRTENSKKSGNAAKLELPKESTKKTPKRSKATEGEGQKSSKDSEGTKSLKKGKKSEGKTKATAGDRRSSSKQSRSSKKPLDGDDDGSRTASGASSSGSSPQDSLPLVQVTFLNSYIARKYDSTFRKMVEAILAREKNNLKEIRQSANDEPVTVVYHDHFQVANVVANKEHKEDRSNGDNNYGLDHDDIPELKQEDEPTEDGKELATPAAASRSRSCFNCGGPHRLDECQERKDWNKINAKRQEFFNSASASGPQNRYHENDNDEDRIKPGEFSDCVPGKVSEDLMNALGMSTRDLPPWILNMRRCGYPPGWIKHSIVQTSGLDFITGDEATGKTSPTGIRYDTTKLPVYPGFSAPHTSEVAKSSLVRIHKDAPLRHQSNSVIESYLTLQRKNAVEPRSPSPDATDGVENMDLSENESPPVRDVKNTAEEQNSSTAFFYESTIPASPDSDIAAENEGSAANSSTPVSTENSSMETAETAQMIEEQVSVSVSVSAGSVQVVEQRTTLLKTSSVPELGVLSGVTSLPSHESFAAGVTAWPFEEPTQSTGRFNAIKDLLRNRKNGSS